MARIGKAEHPRILQMVDDENRKVAEVAAEYGCTPANIYALLSKLRRDARSSPEIETPDTSLLDKPGLFPAEDPAPSDAGTAAVTPALPDLFASDVHTHEPAAPAAVTGKRRGSTTVEIDRVAAVRASTEAPALQAAAAPQLDPEPVASTPIHAANVTDLPRQGRTKKAGGTGAAPAKPGMALMMRTAEGEENLTPFRSLDDLLSAVKPILRAAARSPDAIWFSIQPVDLASLDSDAA